jgi:hypothetical protein
LEKGTEDADFISYLGPTKDDEEWSLGIRKFGSEISQFFIHEEAGDSLGGEAGASLGGGVGPVSGSEGIVDIDFGNTEKFFSENGIILFLLSVEANIFE